MCRPSPPRRRRRRRRRVSRRRRAGWMPIAVAAVSIAVLVGGLIVIANRDTDDTPSDAPAGTGAGCDIAGHARTVQPVPATSYVVTDPDAQQYETVDHRAREPRARARAVPRRGRRVVPTTVRRTLVGRLVVGRARGRAVGQRHDVGRGVRGRHLGSGCPRVHGDECSACRGRRPRAAAGGSEPTSRCRVRHPRAAGRRATRNGRRSRSRRSTATRARGSTSRTGDDRQVHR